MTKVGDSAIKGAKQALGHAIGNSIKILPATDGDLEHIAKIHKIAFTRQNESKKWVSCNFKAYPRIMMFTATINNKCVGYIQWIQKSGFRKETVIELEQIAVLPGQQSKGIGSKLITKSLDLVKEYLESQGSDLKAIIVTTRTDNDAQRLYEKTLNAKVETTITNLYSADEVIMVAKFK